MPILDYGNFKAAKLSIKERRDTIMTQPYKMSSKRYMIKLQFSQTIRLITMAVLLCDCLCLAGCSSFSGMLDDYYNAPVGPAASQTLVGKVAEMVDYAHDPAEPADFVKEARPDPQTVRYEPIKAVNYEHATPLESPEGLKALTAELEAQRSLHDKISGRAPYVPKPKDEKKKPAETATKPVPATAAANNSLFGIVPLGNGFSNQSGSNNAALTNPVPNPASSAPAQ